MKKWLVLLYATMFIGAVVYVIVRQNKGTEIERFSVGDYQYYIDNFASEEIMGRVSNAQNAKKKAEKLWLELFGNHIKKNKPYQVFFDSEFGIWMVQGTLNTNTEGGVPYLIIEKETGKVLAVWHDK